MSAIHQVLLAGGAAAYQVPYSLRFRRANSAYLSRTPASTGNQQVMTFSWWMKIGELPSANQVKVIFASGAAGSNPFFAIGFNDGNNAGGNAPLRMSILEGTSSVLTSLASDMLFRDPSAWYHCVVAIDTTQATSTNRVKLYVNGTQQTLGGTTTYGTSGVYPSLNANINYNTSTYATLIGKSSYLSQYFDGYLAEMNFIDGQALTPSSFGQTDSATGVWVPKKYAGTYGTNGFYLKFADATSTTTIGNDSSGNANNWTTSGISVTSGTTYDQMTDTPTLNYPVWNPLEYDAGLTTQSTPTFADANMKFTGTGGSNNVCTSRSSIGVKTGKWYWETVIVAINGAYPVIGVMSSQPYDRLTSSGSFMGQSATTTMGYSATGSKLQSNSLTAYGNTFAANDVISVALDLDNQKIWFAKNGTWQASGDPAAGTNAAFSGFTVPTDGISAALSGYQSTGASGNFGQRAFSYTPPTGFKALNTANLPTPSIKKGSLYMDATLRTGTGATASVSSLSFAPDLVWIKSRSAATNNNLFDTSRGATVGLVSQTVTAEYTDANSLTAFSSNGYSLGSDASSRGVNINTNTYVDWAWKEGATPGFDVVLYTGNGTNRTVSHSLGVAPACYVCKYRSGSNADEWFMYHKSLGATKYIRWSQALGAYTGSTYWNDTAPTSSVFSLGTNSAINTNSSLYVSYLWSEIEGFSKFGSYVGNGSTDGPFVWCGFTPKWIYIKGDSASSGRQYDTERLPYNQASSPLYFNAASAESAEAGGIDILSNGFKLRWSDSVLNGSGTTFIFMAFAENPFKYSRAR